MGAQSNNGDDRTSGVVSNLIETARRFKDDVLDRIALSKVGEVASDVGFYLEDYRDDVVAISQDVAGLLGSVAKLTGSLVSGNDDLRNFKEPNDTQIRKGLKVNGIQISDCDPSLSNRQYSGTAVAISPDSVFQDVGRGKVVQHARAFLVDSEYNFEIGNQYTLVYRDGAALVLALDRHAHEHQDGVER